MKLIELNQGHEELALALTDKVMANLKKTPNYTGISDPNRFLKGYRGELAMKQLLDEHKTRYDYIPRTDGNSDSGDFIVYERGLPGKLDVKTAGKPTFVFAMIPAAQFKLRRSHFYVGARLTDIRSGPVEIWGWHPLSKVFAWDIKVFGDFTAPTMYYPLHELDDIEDLLYRLDTLDSIRFKGVKIQGE